MEPVTSRHVINPAVRPMLGNCARRCVWTVERRGMARCLFVYVLSLNLSYPFIWPFCLSVWLSKPLWSVYRVYISVYIYIYIMFVWPSAWLCLSIHPKKWKPDKIWQNLLRKAAAHIGLFCQWWYMYVYIYLSTCFVCASILCTPVYLSINLSLCVFLWLSTCLSVFPSYSLSACLL
jgi:hypothetical protein